MPTSGGNDGRKPGLVDGHRGNSFRWVRTHLFVVERNDALSFSAFHSKSVVLRFVLAGAKSKTNGVALEEAGREIARMVTLSS